MHIAIYSHNINKSALDVIDLIIKFFIKHNHWIILYEPLKKEIQGQLHIPDNIQTFSSAKNLNPQTNAFFSIGGDGTILHSITFITNKNIPIIGINTGRMGFLASTALSEITATLNAFIGNEFTIEDRTLIAMQTPEHNFGDMYYALNEFSIFKEKATSMIKLKVDINNIFLNYYWADGLIVSTPTGSTGYSLSNGGPIVTPDSKTFVITPIATHNLTVRPLIIPDHHTITISFQEPEKQAILGLDSRSCIVNAPVEITLKKAEFTIPFIKLNNQNFFKTIREKLLWGLDIRN